MLKKMETPEAVATMEKKWTKAITRAAAGYARQLKTPKNNTFSGAAEPKFMELRNALSL